MGFTKIFSAAFLLALSGAMMPGPLLTITIAQTARKGFVASVLIIAGHAILELALVVGLIFGLGGFVRTHSVMSAIALIGGVMLLWMGWGMLRDALQGRVGLAETVPGGDGGGEAKTPGMPGIRLVGAGIGVSLSNPYWLLWWATVGISGLTLSRELTGSAFTAVSGFFLGHISGDILWYLAVGLAIATGRRLLSPVIYKWIIVVCGTFMIFLGGAFVYAVASGSIWKMSLAVQSVKF